MSKSGYNDRCLINPYGNGSGIMRNKPLELTLYAACAGAFGVFLRWMEDQLAFDEAGLADPSAFHVIVPVFLIVCALVFRNALKQIDRKHYCVPAELEKALKSGVQLQTVLSYVTGGLMILGALLLFAKSEIDKYVGMLRLLSALALLSGVSFPLVLREANRVGPRRGLLCPLMLLPLLTYAVWLILSYRNNSINSVPLAYAMDMLTAIVSMVASFYMAGFAFGDPKPRQTVVWVMFCASVCIMSLADKRYLGMQMMLLATGGQMLLYTWILLRNLQEKERRVVIQKDDGFEHL